MAKSRIVKAIQVPIYEPYQALKCSTKQIIKLNRASIVKCAWCQSIRKLKLLKVQVEKEKYLN